MRSTISLIAASIPDFHLSSVDHDLGAHPQLFIHDGHTDHTLSHGQHVNIIMEGEEMFS